MVKIVVEFHLWFVIHPDALLHDRPRSVVICKPRISLAGFEVFNNFLDRGLAGIKCVVGVVV